MHSAGFTRRTLAALLDAVPALTLWWAASINLSASMSDAIPPNRWNFIDRTVDIFNAAPQVLIWPLLWFSLASVLWHSVTVAFFGTSPGKRVVGIVLLDKRGQGPGVLRSFFHALFKLITSACLALGPLWSLADPERRTLYDRLCGVYVALAPSPSAHNANRRR